MAYEKIKLPLSSVEVAILLDLACYGREFTPLAVWQWLDIDEIESLKQGEITIGHVMASLDSVQSCGGTLDAAHDLPMPEPEYPPPKPKVSTKITPNASF